MAVAARQSSTRQTSWLQTTPPQIFSIVIVACDQTKPRPLLARPGGSKMRDPGNEVDLICGCRWKWRMFKYESFHIYFTSFYSSREIRTQNIDLVPNVGLHISVGRASRRQRGGHRFRIPLKPDCFQPSSFQLLELRHINNRLARYAHLMHSNSWITNVQQRSCPLSME